MVAVWKEAGSGSGSSVVPEAPRNASARYVDHIPQTGDDTNSATPVALALAGLAAVAGAGVLVVRRRNGMSE